jgi:flagellar basal-body rod protein FlgF
MAGLVESAVGILSASERRLETIAQNVSNVSTPGFKRQISFVDTLSERDSASIGALLPHTSPDVSQGRLSETRNPLDVAISGPGYFRVRHGESILYTRQGQFQRAEDGRMVTPQGYTLQSAEGEDLVLVSTAVEIRSDGTVLEQGRPVARIALFAPAEGGSLDPVAGSYFAMAGDGVEEATGAELRQFMVEASNVSMGDEMVAMMAAMRQAENGARLIQVYDELLGRAVTAFGETGR